MIIIDKQVLKALDHSPKHKPAIVAKILAGNDALLSSVATLVGDFCREESLTDFPNPFAFVPAPENMKRIIWAEFFGMQALDAQLKERADKREEQRLAALPEPQEDQSDEHAL